MTQLFQSTCILRLALPVPLPGLFDYIANPDSDAKDFYPGQRILVNFAGRHLVGVIVEIDSESAVPEKKLKTILHCLDTQPLLSSSLLELMRWAADYYHHPIGDVLSTVLPKYFRRAKSKEVQSRDTAKDIVHLKKSFMAAKNKKGAPPLQLNQEQQRAYNGIAKNMTQFSVHLIDGVTGSGKTEIYLQLIQTIIEKNQKALVLVPEIGLTPQTLLRFSMRFAVPILVFHSHLTDKSRAVSWLQSAEPGPAILIGTRSALFSPCLALGLIVIDEEHDSSFKQQEGFHYSARDLAIVRAKQENIPIVLGTATPSLESFHNAISGRYHHHVLKMRVNDLVLPIIQCVDLRQASMTQGLASETVQAITSHLQAGNQVLVFINRRGYAPIVLCHHCAWVATCAHCDARLTFHAAHHKLVCHHCQATQSLPEVCPSCVSPQLLPVGYGTQRIEQRLSQLFPVYPLVRIDRDTTSQKGQLEQLLSEVAIGKHQLLVGTQMLAKGHHFEKLSLVVILNADAGLMGIDYRASERFGQLLWQVAGRAGRGDTQGEVIIQTHYPTHPLLLTLLQSGYRAFAEKLLIERQMAMLPPAVYEALVFAEGESERIVLAYLSKLKGSLPHQAQGQCHGPVPAMLARKAGRYHAYLVLQSPVRSQLHQALNRLTAWMQAHKPPKTLRLGIDVDPIDLF